MFCYHSSMESALHAHTEAAALAAALEQYQAEHASQCCETVLGDWAGLVFDPAVVAGWNPEQSRDGLIMLERLSRSIAAVKVVLVTQLEAGRDTTAAIIRATGVSTSQAHELRRAAKVVEQHPSALASLANGSVSTEHLAKVSHLKPELATELLGAVDGRSADDFRRFVDETRVQRESSHCSAGAIEHHNSRSVKIYRKRNGCIGFNIVLPPVEGNELANTLRAIADQHWRANHPERNTVADPHNVEPLERRVADALVSWIRNGNTATGKPAVIVIIEAETLNAHVVPHQPIPTNDALEVMARANVYAAIRDGTMIANLKFGRNNRVATPLQHLAMLTYYETCQAPGCTVPATQCEAHHVIYYEHGGNSNIENFIPLCTGQQGHHPHQHQAA
jgi:hypothetical protein